ncbi:hypothetical protein [Mogibacterium pumilum]|uniref:hypothetical protein n=1 Tax=Mogibacterium pumilum TaxID=86332 RepID=UPI0012FC8428|nr:hypothetical protein [Mogibacterium pumilum]
MVFKIAIWVIFAVAIVVKLYTKKRIQNIDGFGGITTREEVYKAKRDAINK